MVAFNQIPSVVRTPFFFIEFDGVPTDDETLDVSPALIIAQKLAAGTADADVPIRVIGADDAPGYFGQGSHAARMVKLFRKNNPSKELWVIPLADNGSTKMTNVVDVTGPATEGGAVYFYIAGQQIVATVASGDTAETVAGTLRDAISDAPELSVEYLAASITAKTKTYAVEADDETFTVAAHGLANGDPVTFANIVGSTGIAVLTTYYVTNAATNTFTVSLTVGGGTVPITLDGSGDVLYTNRWQITLKAKNAGTLGNDIDFRTNYLGSAAGERLPAGVTVTPAQTVPGATDPSLSTAITAMGTEGYDYVLCPFATTTILDALKTEMDSRWAYNRQIYGHVVSGNRETKANLLTFGSGRNNRHETVFGFYDYPSPVWDIVGAAGGQLSNLLDSDPALPEQSLQLAGIVFPKIGSTGRFTDAEREALLEGGVATFTVGRNSCALERAITSYQTNAQDIADTTYLDIQTAFTMMRCARYMKRRVVTKFGRKKLASDGSRLPAESNVVTPSVVFNELVMVYGDLIELGWVEDMDWFKSNAKVVRDPNDVNRLNVIFPPDFVNQLRVFATLFRFKQ